MVFFLLTSFVVVVPSHNLKVKNRLEGFAAGIALVDFYWPFHTIDG